MTSKESTIQLKQKLIHYRAEIVNFEQRIYQLERDLKKERMRNQYLQKKRYEAEHVNIHSYEKELNHLKDQLLMFEVALEEEKERNHILVMREVQDRPVATKPELRAFFNYAFLLSDYSNERKEVIIIGDLSIQNTGVESLHNLTICIRITPNQAGQLNGKILTSTPQYAEQSLFSNQRAEEWQFVHENFREKISESGEYWIRPTQIQELKQTEQISFTNFELILTPPINQHSVIVNGFAYCNEIPTGIKVENNIIVNY